MQRHGSQDGQSPTPIGDASHDLRPQGIAVTPGGTAMVLWRAIDAADVFYSAVRAPGGGWGTPQEIARDAPSSRQFAMSDAGDAVAAWNGGGIFASVRPAGGSWQATPTTLKSTDQAVKVAMSATGDAVVLTHTGAPFQMQAYYRPAGGSWSGPEKVRDSGVTLNAAPMAVAFDGSGRAVALFAIHTSVGDFMYQAVRPATGWVSDLLESYQVIGEPQLVRHPSGLVAIWGQQPTATNFSADLVVGLVNGTSWRLHTYDLATRFVDISAAADSEGKVLIAGQLDHGPGDTLQDIWGATLPSLTFPDAEWPALTSYSPASNGTTQLYRRPLAAAGGTDFFLGWSVHGTQPNHSQAIATNAVPACAGTSAPTPTVTPAPTTTPPAPLPEPKPKPKLAKPPSAIGGFATLPAANRCVQARTMKLRIKAPKGFAVARVTVRVNGKRAAVLTGKKLKRALTLRKLPRGAYTVELVVKLKDGRTVTGKRRFRACR